jgi:hypothetical protein
MSEAAGRELDAEVAEKVVGIKPRKFVPGAEDGLDKTDWWYFSKNGSHRLVPNYSTNIAAAWEVVEHFGQAGYSVNLSYGHKTH